MKNSTSQKSFCATLLTSNYSLKKFTIQFLSVGIFFAMFSTIGSAVAQNLDYAGDWVGTITIRPPGQDEVKKYKVTLKLGKLTNNAKNENWYYHPILAAQIGLEGRPNLINLHLRNDAQYGRFGNSPQIPFQSIGLIDRSVYRKDGGVLSKAFPDCNDRLELSNLKIDSSGNFAQGKSSCDNNINEIYNPNQGTVTLQRSGSVGSSAQSFPEDQNSQTVPSSQTPPTSPNRSVIDTVKNKVPGVLRNIFR
jgi:hypothetical protein